MALDSEQGPGIAMVKLALPYLDNIFWVKDPIGLSAIAVSHTA